MDRVKLCEALKKLCLEFGNDQVKEALDDAIDAIEQDTGEMDFEELSNERETEGNQFPR